MAVLVELVASTMDAHFETIRAALGRPLIVSAQWTSGQPAGCGWSILMPLFGVPVGKTYSV
jgi:hypothetical protein